MLRLTVAAMLALGLVAAVVGTAGGERITDTEQRSVEIATLPCERNLQATSSGFVLDDELVVTVAHAIFESRDFAVRDTNGTWHDAVVQYMDLERDLAVVRVKGLQATPMITAAASAGTSISMVEGAATGDLDGLVTRRVKIRTEVVGDLSEESVRRGYELALDIKAGDSGAAVVDNEGRLVAVVFARSTRREGVTWATSASEIDSILRRGGVPSWDCGPGFGTELVLEEPEERRLAG